MRRVAWIIAGSLCVLATALGADVGTQMGVDAAGGLRFLNDSDAMQRIEALADEKAKRASAVLSFINNHQLYPTPANVVGFRPGTDLQKGQVELEKLTALAIDAHNALEAELLTLTGAAKLVDYEPTEMPLPAQFANQTMPPGFDRQRLPRGERTWIDWPTNPRPVFDGTVMRPPPASEAKIDMAEGQPVPIVLYAIIDSSPAWCDWLKRLSDGEVRGEPAPLLRALRALGATDYELAKRLSAELQGRERWFFDHVARHAIWAYNARQREGTDRPNPAELEVIESINSYRMALNLVPWAVDDRLQQAAIFHSAYQVQTGQIGHEQRDPSMRHSWQRARKFGYPAEDVTEVISNGLGPWTLWGWRGDAGHHRALVRPTTRVCGMGIEGQYVTCLSASHDDSPFAAMVERTRKPAYPLRP